MDINRLDKITKERIRELCFPVDSKEPITAAAAWEQLSLDNLKAGKNIYVETSTPRPVQKYVKKIRERESEGMQLDREPWNLLLNEKAGIPFDPILLQLLEFWYTGKMGRKDRAPISKQPFGIAPFPVGIAKWAVRLHRVAPYLSIEELLYRAKRYWAMERLASFADAEPNSDYDDLEITIKGDCGQPLKTAFEKYYPKDSELGEKENERAHNQKI